MSALALTDAGNMFGAAEFYFNCVDGGIKPILGLEALTNEPSTLQSKMSPFDLKRLVLLAKNFNGYQNLCELITESYFGPTTLTAYPLVSNKILERHREDLLVLTGGTYGELYQIFKDKGADAAFIRVQELVSIFGQSSVYMELSRCGVRLENDFNQFQLEVADKLKLKAVATNPIYYIKPSDLRSQETLLCIAASKTLASPDRHSLGSSEFYFRSEAEMRDIFSDLPHLVDESQNIADQIGIKFKTKDEQGKAIYHLPSFDTGDVATSPSQYIKIKVAEGLAARMAEPCVKDGFERDPKVYQDRIDYELSIIEKMGFTSYFLIVQDFINWAKATGIPVGPGRGSGAGSLVAFCLRITDLDPMPYNLLFERFLNPDRISMPDFDIDFCMDRRGEVIQYVFDRYGAENVAQIITYGKLQARAALRDVGRVLGMSFTETDQIAKLMPDQLGITLEKAIETESRLQEQAQANPVVAQMLDLARSIEGLVRHAGIHAAGVIIGDAKLSHYAPLYRGAADERVVQFDMKWAEKIGLIKFDFLGLKTLTHINEALILIEKNHGKKIEASSIPINDVGIYELMSQGDTAGIFQFEGDGITDAVKKIRPKTFEDITAINALYRPGPMDMIPEYTKRMHGESPVDYIFDELEPILKETYGITVYQEQVMAIASKIANYSLGEADLLRRAMGKKIASEMAKQKKRFLDGAAENKFDKNKASELFEKLEKFAEYGFNKSHAAAYCVISAQTAWLKKYYTAEFFAALLTTEITNTENVVRYIKDARRHGIEIVAPHINTSDWKFDVMEGKIVYGLGAIKGVGQAAIESIVEARQKCGGRFESLEQFFDSVDLRRINKKVIESLIKASAFSGFGPHSAQIFGHFDLYTSRAEASRKDKENGQFSMFDQLADDLGPVILPEALKWTRTQVLKFERDVLGFYLTDHPLRGYTKSLKIFIHGDIAHIKDKVSAGTRVVCAGLIGRHREIQSRKGTPMSFSYLEDESSEIEIITLPEVFAQYGFYLHQDQPILLAGQLKRENETVKIMTEKIGILDDILQKVKSVRLWLSPEEVEKHLGPIEKVLAHSPGQTKIEIALMLSDLDQEVVFELEESNGVRLTNEVVESLCSQVGRYDLLEVRL